MNIHHHRVARLTLAGRFCDSLLVLKDGQVVVFGQTDDILSRQCIAECWNVSVEVMQAKDGGDREAL